MAFSEFRRGRFAITHAQRSPAQFFILLLASVPDHPPQTTASGVAIDDLPAWLRCLCRTRRHRSRDSAGCLNPYPVAPRTSDRGGWPDTPCSHRAAGVDLLDRNATMESRAELDRPSGLHPGGLGYDMHASAFFADPTSLLMGATTTASAWGGMPRDAAESWRWGILPERPDVPR